MVKQRTIDYNFLPWKFTIMIMSLTCLQAWNKPLDVMYQQCLGQNFTFDDSEVNRTLLLNQVEVKVLTYLRSVITCDTLFPLSTCMQCNNGPDLEQTHTHTHKRPMRTFETFNLLTGLSYVNILDWCRLRIRSCMKFLSNVLVSYYLFIVVILVIWFRPSRRHIVLKDVMVLSIILFDCYHVKVLYLLQQTWCIFICLLYYLLSACDNKWWTIIVNFYN